MHLPFSKPLAGLPALFCLTFCGPDDVAAEGSFQGPMIAENRKSTLSGEFSPNAITTLQARPLTEPIHIDGLIEDAWLQGAHFENFVENWPNESQRPKAQTEGYITYDNENLYVAFICYDPEMRNLRAHLSDRDQLYQDDFVGINFDTYGTKQNSFEFFVNPLGMQADLAVTQNGLDNNEDDSYDALWYSDAKIYNDRWTVEMKIPFKSLRFPNNPEQDWLVHMLRIYPRDSRYVYSWMPIPRGTNNEFSLAGHLKMDSPTTKAGNLEFLPYAIGSSDRTMDETPSGNGKWSKSELGKDAGFNAKYGIASNLTLDVAYNPDFSQIESDAGQISVNNPYALYNREKRPFFLEGGDIFSAGGDINLLYTRTINDPLLATKLSGKMGKLSFGLIEAYDESSIFILPVEESSSQSRTVNHSWNSIARGKYDLGNGSYFGVVGTDRRFTGSGAHNTVGAIDTRIRLNDQITVQGLLGIGTTKELNGSNVKLATSDDSPDSIAFVANGKTYDTDFNGQTYSGTVIRATIEKSGKTWIGNAWYNDVSPGFHSENGFINRNNYREAGLWTGYNFWFDPAHPVFNRIRPQVNTNRKYNYDGSLKDFWIGPGLFIQFKHQTGFFTQYALVNNENYHGKQFNNIHRASLNMWTDWFTTVSGGFWTEAGNYINRDGDPADTYNPLAIIKGFQFNAWMTLRPMSQLSNEFNFTSASFWKSFGGSPIVRQLIYRDAVQYQFTRQLFLRLIGEMDVFDYYAAKTDDDGNYVLAGGKQIRDRSHDVYFSLSPLVSYKINAFKVFFVGANIGGSRSPYNNETGLTTTSTNIFMKFQYFMRI